MPDEERDKGFKPLASTNEEQVYKSPIGQYLDAVVSPGEAFRGLKARPRWLVFFLLTLAVSLATLPLLMPYSVTAQREAINEILRENRDAMPAEQVARLEEFRDHAGTGFMGEVFPYLGVPVSLFIYLLLASAGLNVGVGLTGQKLGFRNAVSIVSLASVAMAAGVVVMLVLVLVKGDVYVGTNLGLLFPRMPSEWYMKVLRGFASQIDVFSAWSVYLLTVGVREVTGLSVKRSFRVVFILWLLWALVMTALSYFGFAQ
ncbi:MAG: Yip1 family protein [bacterium]|nr:Yip1 family protein [bacterium]